MEFKALNFMNWINEHRHLLKPPVGNKMIWKDREFIVMVVGGPNERQDFHYNEGEEFFYQLEGDMLVKVYDEGEIKELSIKEGEIFLLPAKVPHNPIRPKNTVGLVIERRRPKDQLDGLKWYCQKCSTLLYEEFFHLTNIENQFQGVFKRYYSDEKKMTCQKCGYFNATEDDGKKDELF